VQCKPFGKEHKEILEFLVREGPLSFDADDGERKTVVEKATTKSYTNIAQLVSLEID
jgi:hypothetical protein